MRGSPRAGPGGYAAVQNQLGTWVIWHWGRRWMIDLPSKEAAEVVIKMMLSIAT